MALPVTLNTNEVKNAAGAEVEFTRLGSPNAGRSILFAQSNEQPNLEHRLAISHQETGSGADRVRRSVVRVDKTVVGASGKLRKISNYEVAVIPVGDIASYNDVKDVNAELLSFCATTGAASTVLFDGTGNGSVCLINGGL